jgi:hypothetical protein
MERKGATSSQWWRLAGGGIAGKSSYHSPGRRFSGKTAVVAVGVMVVLAVFAFSVHRETTTSVGVTARAPANPPKPAYTRAEEAYIRALWPIHGDVERSTLRLSLGKIFYTTKDLSKAELKTRIDTAMATYQNAEGRIRALQPPPSLARAQDDYLAAVRLFKQSATEALKMFEDSNDNHLLAAYPLSQEGSTMIRAVGARFWQDEFPPN